MTHHHRTRLVLVTVWAVLCPATTRTVSAQGTAPPADQVLPVDSLVTVGTLENGLRYYIRVNRRPKERAELRLVVNAGSVLEDADQLGLAHFVEHMAFNSTKNFPKHELVSYLEQIGMRFGPDVNAYTSFDETVYMLTVPTDSAEILAKAFQILEDWAHGQAFDPEEIDMERGVVVEEWRLRRGADARMLDKQYPILLRGSRYAERLPIGKKEILEGFEHETLERYYDEWYRPDLMAVIAVGDFDPQQIEQLIHTHFSIPGPTTPAARPLFEMPDHSETLFAIATDPEATKSQVSIYFKQPLREQGTVGAYRQFIVERLYNRMLNARLFELTRTPDPPFIGGFSGQGLFVRSKEAYVLGAVVADGGIARGLEALLTEAKRVSRHGFTATELDRHKRELLRAMELAYAEREKTDSWMYASEYTRSFLEGEPIPGIAYELELTRQLFPTIELGEVDRLARSWITDENRVILVSAPEKDGVEVPEEADLHDVFGVVAAKDVEAYDDAVADAPLVDELPAPVPIVAEEIVDEIGATIWELENGVRVILKPTDFKDDEIVMYASSPGGTSLVPDEDYVAAMTAASVINQSGVGEFSLIDLQKELSDKAVGVAPYVGSLYEGLSGSASPRDVETLFQLIYLYFTAPRKDSVAFLTYQNQVKAMLENQGASPEVAFQDTVMVTLAQHHFRARSRTSELFDEMDFEKSYAFYRDRFADAGDFTFVFVGAFDIDSLRPLVRRYLGGLPATGREETWRDIGIDPPLGVVHKEVHRGIEAKSLTQIVFTGPAEYTRENRHALRSLAQILQIRLRERLREDLGGTYSVNVGGFLSPEPDQDYRLSVNFGSAPERVDELVGVVFQQIDSLRTAGPSEVDVSKVQEIQRRLRETDLKENGYWAFQLVAYDRYGVDFREILTNGELIDLIDVTAVRDAARRFFNTDNYVRVTLYPEGDERR